MLVAILPYWQIFHFKKKRDWCLDQKTTQTQFEVQRLKFSASCGSVSGTVCVYESLWYNKTWWGYFCFGPSVPSSLWLIFFYSLIIRVMLCLILWLHWTTWRSITKGSFTFKLWLQPGDSSKGMINDSELIRSLYISIKVVK